MNNNCFHDTRKNQLVNDETAQTGAFLQTILFEMFQTEGSLLIINNNNALSEGAFV